MDYTVIMPVRQHFGDEPGSYDFPFAGMTTLNQVPPFDPRPEWLFDCPNVDSSQPAILMFESIGVDHDRNQFEIKRTTIAGGVPISPTSDHLVRQRDARGYWNAQVSGQLPPRCFAR